MKKIKTDFLIVNANLKPPWKILNGMAQCPVVMIVSGVLDGNQGPIFWPASVLEANAKEWQDVPITINHPVEDGKHVSVHVSTWEKIGKVISPLYDAAKKAITAMVSIPADHPELDLIQTLKEVSIGVFGDHTETFGQYHGEQYKMSAISMIPDHLALLTDAEGACSVRDGCGLRAYSQMQEHLYPGDVQMETNINSKNQKEMVNNDKHLYPGGILDAAASKVAPGMDTLKVWAEEKIKNYRVDSEMSELLEFGEGFVKFSQQNIRTSETKTFEAKWVWDGANLKIDFTNMIQINSTKMENKDDGNLYPAGMKMESGQVQNNEVVTECMMVNAILINTGDVWTKESLKKQGSDFIQRLYKSIPIEVNDYSLNAGGSKPGKSNDPGHMMHNTEI